MKRTKNRIHTVLFMLLIALAMTAVVGCRSTRKATLPGALTLKELKNLPAVKAETKNLSAKIKLQANLKGNEITANGTLKIKRDEGIIISVNALGGIIEVARIEITPDEALLVYRLGRKYARIRYSEIETLDALGLNYNMLQSLLLNEIFTPDGTPAEKGIDKMDITAANGEVILSATNKRIKYTFHINPSEGTLVLTQGNYNRQLNVDCNYSGFTATGTGKHPARIHLSVEDISLNLQLSNMKETPLKLNRTTDISAYEKIEISNLLKLLKQSPSDDAQNKNDTHPAAPVGASYAAPCAAHLCQGYA